MPDEIVANDEHAVLFTKLDEAIGGLKVELFRLRMDLLPFQQVFRGDRVELFRGQLQGSRLVADDLVGAERNPDSEVIVERLLERRLSRGQSRIRSQANGKRC